MRKTENYKIKVRDKTQELYIHIHINIHIELNKIQKKLFRLAESNKILVTYYKYDLHP